MKKYSFLVYHAVYPDFLQRIREIGVLHVIEKAEGTPDDEELNEKLKLSAGVRSAIKTLETYIHKDTVLQKSDKVADIQLLDDIDFRLKNKELLQQKLHADEIELDKMTVWGSFSHETLANLQNAGLIVNFFNCNIRKFNQEWIDQYHAFEIGHVGTIVYFITVTRPGEVIDIDADPVKLSQRSSSQIAADIQLTKSQIEEVVDGLAVLTSEKYSELENLLVSVQGEIDYKKVVLHTSAEAEEKVMLLEGWSPVDKTEELVKFLEESGTYYEVSEPLADERVPIKLKNNRFSRLYEMIGDLYDLPNYHELDLTPFFAPFFMLFFGLCLGDTAYGLLFLILAIVMKRKAKPAMKPVFELMIWLGSSTVIMGLVTGTFFGFSLVEVNIPWLEQFKKYMLNANDIFYASLILGVIQILYGMIIKAVGIVIRFGWAASLSTWGWLLILIGMGGTAALDATVGLNPQVVKYLYYGFGGLGGLLVFILNDIKRNPLINVGAGLWDSYNMATGLLGDVLSYVRLFALSISGSVMGFVFNDLAIKLSGDIPVVSPIIMIIIMLFGHGINIFMSALGAFVHPLRLTFVEFYKNAGFEGGGKKYNPFASIHK
jgi:V/A-type H+-transporting ATPase subunit I